MRTVQLIISHFHLCQMPFNTGNILKSLGGNERSAVLCSGAFRLGPGTGKH